MTERRQHEGGRLPIEEWKQRYLPDWYHEAFFPPSVASKQKPPERFREHRFYLSPRLRENPKARLDLPTEIAEVRSQWQPGYRAAIERITGTQLHEFDKQNPAITNLRGMGFMPVLLTETPDVFETTLETYGDQDIHPSEWRLLTFFNFYGAPTDEHRDALRDKFKMVVNAQKNGLPIIAAFDSYPKPHSIGLIRAQAWDMGLEYLMQKRVDHDIVGISQDADGVARSSNYISGLCEAAEQNPDKDVFTGNHHWEAVGDPDSPEQKAMVYLDFLSELSRREDGSAYTIDGNMAFRMSAYAAIGGYKNDLLNETQLLARHIEIGRGYREGPMHPGLDRTGLFVPDITLTSSSRRQKISIAQGRSPHSAWEITPFSTEDDQMRGTHEPVAPGSYDLKAIVDEMEAHIFDPTQRVVSHHAREQMAAARKELGLAS